MSYSAKIKLKTDYPGGKTSRRDGTSAVYLQIIVNRTIKKIDLHVYWAPNFWDFQTGEAKPRYRGDTGAVDVNLIAGQASAKANDIFVQWRLRKLEPTLEGFLRDYYSKLNKSNLCEYFAQKLEQRYAAGEICELTYNIQRSSLKALKTFRPELPFVFLSDFGFAKKFDNYLKKEGKKATTRWSRHKDVITYLNLARREDYIVFPDPYLNFKNKKAAGSWVAAASKEIDLLDQYYRTLSPGTTRRRVLQRWLFGVATALRISDQQRVKPDWLIDDVLAFLPHKGRESGDVLRMPLSARARELFNDGLQERDGATVFTSMTGQKSNEIMAAIRTELGIKSRLHNHIGRESFATLYLENGGRLEVLREYMGHKHIQTTMKYVHVSMERKRAEVSNLDKIFRSTNPELNVISNKA